MDVWTGAVGLWLIDELEVWVFGGWLDLRCVCVADGWNGGVAVLLTAGLEVWVLG